MIYYLIMPFLSLLLLIFQVNILELVFFGKIGLEISLLIVIFAGFRLSMAKGGTLSFVLGFIFDCITGSITGFHTFFYIAVFLSARLISRRVYSEGIFFIIIFAFCASLMEGVFLSLIYKFVYDLDNYYKILKIYLPQSIMAAFLGPAVFLILGRAEAFLYVREQK